MPLTTIDSLQNQRVKRARALTQKRQRDREGLFLLEGERELERGLDAGIEGTQIMLCPELFKHGKASESLHDKLITGDTPVIYLTKQVFEHCSYRENPDGFLAICKTFRRSLEELVLSDNPLILIVESLEKPGNLGTILRTADAVGVDAVILNDPVTDIFNPNVIRASAGVVFNVPTAIATKEETLHFLKEHSIRSVATTPDTETLYHEVSFCKPSAILVGSEKDGLGNFWLNEANLKTRLPMSGRADSLNVSVTTAIMLYEAVRQRTLA
ncbi:MAG: RNA methyltransferase [Verrucomicrobia bacterium]|nr:RNA methyltransferase [Verrucomicrobiota bacterium]MDA1067757.1 RNA methyltransferase [Verrucomicrobiota bacterium]